MSNKPKILMEFSPEDASYLMDLMHKDWHQQVQAYGVFFDSPDRPYDAHVWEYRKRRPSRLMNYMDDTAEKQGFWEDGKGL